MKYWTRKNQKIATLIMKEENDEFQVYMRTMYPNYRRTINDAAVSYHNNKVGNTWNFSLPAVFTCGKRALETCGDCKNGMHCYATKDYRNPSVVAARFINLNLAMHHMEELENQIEASIFINERKCEKNGKESVARLHESGEFFSMEYLEMWMRIARRHPNTTFYTYSTKYEYMEEIIPVKPENLKILPSGWEGREIPEKVKEYYGETTVIQKAEDLPKGFFLCPGTGKKSDRKTCEACGWMCAKVKKVAFIYHN